MTTTPRRGTVRRRASVAEFTIRRHQPPEVLTPWLGSFWTVTCVDPASLAPRRGFYDQAHLRRTFAQMLGETPAGYAVRALVGALDTASRSV